MKYTARVSWRRNTLPFNAKSFDRTHKIYFDSGLSIEASSAPEFLGRTDLPNPEELFTASISSCFMLTFLYWAAAEGIIIDQYTDEAYGVLAKSDEGKMMITEVVLNPKIIFQKKPQTVDLYTALIKKAHENCFISSSVKSKIVVKTEQLAYA